MIFAGHFVGLLALVHLVREKLPPPWWWAWGVRIALFAILDFTSRSLAFRPWDGIVALSYGALNVAIIVMYLKDRRPENAGVVYSVIAAYALPTFFTLRKFVDVLTATTNAVTIASLGGVNAAVVLSATTSIGREPWVFPCSPSPAVRSAWTISRVAAP